MEKSTKTKQPKKKTQNKLENLVKKYIEDNKPKLFGHPTIIAVLLSLAVTMVWNYYSFHKEAEDRFKKYNLDKKLYDYKMTQDKKLYDYKIKQDRRLFDYKMCQDKKQDAYTNKAEFRKLLGELINLTLKVKKAKDLDEDFIKQEITFKTKRALKLETLIKKTEYDLSAPECSTFAFLLLQQPKQSYKNIFYFIKAGLNKTPTLETRKELLSYTERYFYGLNSDINDKEQFQKALDTIKENKEYAAFCNYAAQILYEFGEYESAIECYNKVIEESPNNIRACFFRGKSLYLLKKHKEAIKDFTRVIQADPKNLVACALRGECWREEKKYEDALLDSGRALSINIEKNPFKIGTKEEYSLLLTCWWRIYIDMWYLAIDRFIKPKIQLEDKNKEE